MDHSKSEDTTTRPLAPGETAMVSLSIPCSPEYVGTARLTILGVASRMGFTYDQVEDIRLAVGEACANAIERCDKGKRGATPPTITIRSQVEAARLTIEVEDTGSPMGLGASGEGIDTDRPASEIEGMNSQELGALLMEILVDEVTVEALGDGGTRVRLVKFANET
jgi:serine/threonine-protein kinase RsbW